MSSVIRNRADRLAQARHRGTKTSHKTEMENALILIAWEAGELTEGQAATALGVDRLAARLKRETAIGKGITLAYALREKKA